MKSTDSNSKKYKVLLRIILAEFIMLKILSTYGVQLGPLSVRIPVLVIVLAPIMILLYTVSGDPKFRPPVRTLAEIGLWFLSICAVCGIVAEVMALVDSSAS